MNGISVIEVLVQAGIDPSALARAGARVLPAALLVPAFGLRALPRVGRLVIALVLATALAPAVAADAPLDGVPVSLVLLFELVRGLLVATGAVIPLWVATMAGDTASIAVGFAPAVRSPVVPDATTPLGVLASLFASAAFLASGGASRLVQALGDAPLEAAPIERVVTDLTAGITLGVGVAAPLFAMMLVVDIARALATRAARPLPIGPALRPLRAVATTLVLALALEHTALAVGRVLR